MMKLAIFLGVFLSLIIGRDATKNNDEYCEEMNHSSE